LERELVEKVGQGAALHGLRGPREGEREFLKLAQAMVARGVLRLRERETERLSGEEKSALELYRELLRTICQALNNAGKGLDELRAYFANPAPGLEGAFEGVMLEDDGSLDVHRVMANLSAGDEAVGRALAYEALDAFASYALFSAKNALPPELADLLAAEFRRVSEASR
jgi:hypothetical protein